MEVRLPLLVDGKTVFRSVKMVSRKGGAEDPAIMTELTVLNKIRATGHLYTMHFPLVHEFLLVSSLFCLPDL